jgi:hypothetical protein
LNGGASGLTVQTPAEDGFRFEVVEEQLIADTQSLYMPVILKE